MSWEGRRGGHNEVCVDVRDEAHFKGAVLCLGLSSPSPNRSTPPPSSAPTLLPSFLPLASPPSLLVSSASVSPTSSLSPSERGVLPVLCLSLAYSWYLECPGGLTNVEIVEKMSKAKLCCLRHTKRSKHRRSYCWGLSVSWGSSQCQKPKGRVPSQCLPPKHQPGKCFPHSLKVLTWVSPS